MIRRDAKITGVALKFEDGHVISLPLPSAHYHIERDEVKERKYIEMSYEKGFINEDGIFLTRRQAKRIAQRNNQLGKTARNNDELFSDELEC